jgi:hypothetical protein
MIDWNTEKEEQSKRKRERRRRGRSATPLLVENTNVGKEVREEQSFEGSGRSTPPLRLGERLGGSQESQGGGESNSKGKGEEGEAKSEEGDNWPVTCTKDWWLKDWWLKYVMLKKFEERIADGWKKMSNTFQGSFLMPELIFLSWFGGVGQRKETD